MSKCQICNEYFDDSEMYEYRGFLACEKHFDELCKKVDYKKVETMETIKASTDSQRNGEFINNRNKYNTHNVASDGLPVIKIKEPMIEEEYRKGIL